MPVVAILNPKGGSGKSTSAVHIARQLLLEGERVVLIDTDPQGTARDWRAAGGESSPLPPVIGLDRPHAVASEVPVLRQAYDWIVIDGAAKLGKQSIEPVRTADLVLVAVQASAADLWGAAELVEAIQAKQQITDGQPQAAYLVTRAKRGTVLGREIERAASEVGLGLMTTRIHEREVYKKVVGEGVCAQDLAKDPDDPSAHEIKMLVREIRQMLGGVA